MTTLIQTQTGAASRMLPLIFAASLGVAIIALAGHVQASALHDAAHDVRHATGCPCH